MATWDCTTQFDNTSTYEIKTLAPNAVPVYNTPPGKLTISSATNVCWVDVTDIASHGAFHVQMVVTDTNAISSANTFFTIGYKQNKNSKDSMSVVRNKGENFLRLFCPSTGQHSTPVEEVVVSIGVPFTIDLLYKPYRVGNQVELRVNAVTASFLQPGIVIKGLNLHTPWLLLGTTGYSNRRLGQSSTFFDVGSIEIDAFSVHPLPVEDFRYPFTQHLEYTNPATGTFETSTVLRSPSSVSAWIYFSGSPTERSCYVWLGGTEEYIAFLKDSDDGIQCVNEIGVLGDISNVTPGWHEICFAFDTQETVAYVDSRVIGRAQKGYKELKRLGIGRSFTETSGGFSMRDLAVYNTFLSRESLNIRPGYPFDHPTSRNAISFYPLNDSGEDFIGENNLIARNAPTSFSTLVLDSSFDADYTEHTSLYANQDPLRYVQNLPTAEIWKSMSFGAQWSVSFWIRVADLDNDIALVKVGTMGGETIVYATSTQTVDIHDGDTQDSHTLAVTGSIGYSILYRWTHVCIVRSATNYTTYVNGAQIFDTTRPIGGDDTREGIQFGAPSNVSGFRISDVAIWTTLLASGDAGALFNGTDPMNVGTPLFVFPCDGDLSAKPNRCVFLRSVQDISFVADTPKRSTSSRSYHLNGSSDYISDPSLVLGDDFTFCVWVKINAVPLLATIMQLTESTTRVNVNVDTNRRIQFEVEASGYGPVTTLVPLVLSLSDWHHVTIVRDHSTAHVRVYINAVLVSFIPETNPIGGGGTTVTATIGASHSPSLTNFFDGHIDEVAWWDIPLRDHHVRDAYAQSFLTGSLKSHIRFELPSGTVAVDEVPHGSITQSGTTYDNDVPGYDHNALHTSMRDQTIRSTLFDEVISQFNLSFWITLRSHNSAQESIVMIQNRDEYPRITLSTDVMGRVVLKAILSNVDKRCFFIPNYVPLRATNFVQLSIDLESVLRLNINGTPLVESTISVSFDAFVVIFGPFHGTLARASLGDYAPHDTYQRTPFRYPISETTTFTNAETLVDVGNLSKSSSLILNGTTDYIRSDVPFTTSTGMSSSIWFYLESLPTTEPMYVLSLNQSEHSGQEAETRAIELFVDVDGKIGGPIKSSTTVREKTWTHLGFTVNDSFDTTIYVNGTAEANAYAVASTKSLSLDGQRAYVNNLTLSTVSAWVKTVATTHQTVAYSGEEPTTKAEFFNNYRQVIEASDAVHKFGESASISGDGLYAAIGAVNNDNPAVYIFKRIDAAWIEQTKIEPSDGSGKTLRSVSISGDGSYVIVGAATLTGVVYIFKRDNETWTEQVRIENPSGFGNRVSMSGDGSYAMIGSPDETENTGAVYFYARDGVTWTLHTKILGTGTGNALGMFVSISYDGSYAVANASSSAAHIYYRGVTSWEEQHQIVLPSEGVSISHDGTYVLLGGTLPYDGASVYVFKRIGTTWSEDTTLVNEEPYLNKGFDSKNVSISGDGSIIIVSTKSHSLSNVNGAVFVYKHDGTSWTRRMKMFEDNRASSAFYASGLTISDDGNHIIVQDQFSGGAVYIYSTLNVYEAPDETCGITLAPTYTTRAALIEYQLETPNGQPNFGKEVSMSGNGMYMVISQRSRDRFHTLTRVGSSWVNESWSIQQSVLVPEYHSYPSLSSDGSFLCFTGYLANELVATVYVRSGTSWIGPTEIRGSRNLGNGGDSLFRGARISGDGKYIIWCIDNSTTISRNNVYIFESDGSTWTEQVLRSTTEQGVHFRSGRISSDGSLVTFIQTRDVGSDEIITYVRSGTSWVEQTANPKPLPYGLDEAFFSTDMSTDGTYLIACAQRGLASNVYIFERDGDAWRRQATITSPDPIDSLFGYGVLISDGGRIAMMTSFERPGQPWKLYTFKRDGTSWVQQSVYQNPAHQFFGFERAISMSSDGKYGVIGVELAHVREDPDSGLLYIIKNVPVYGSDLRVTDSGDNFCEYTNTTLNDGAWHHVSIAYGSTMATTYVDGVQDSMTTLSQAHNGINLSIGGTLFKGNVDEVSIFNTHLNAHEIAELYNRGTPPNVLLHSKNIDLVAYYHFEDDLLDSSGNANHLAYDGIETYATDVPPVSFYDFSTDGGYTVVAGAHVHHDPTNFTLYRSLSRLADNSSTYGYHLEVAKQSNYAIVGSPTSTVGGESVGAIEIHSGWGSQQRIIASDGLLDDHFGGAVSISQHGNYVCVGAHKRGSDRGRVYVFSRSGSDWSEVMVLEGDDALDGDMFGYSVRMTEDYVLVGSPGHGTGAGAIYIFKRVGFTWSYIQKLTVSEDFGRFGTNISLAENANVLSIGAPSDGTLAGKVYVFGKKNGTWEQMNALQPADSHVGDTFGYTQTMDFKNNYIAVGAENHSVHGHAMTIFRYCKGVWNELAVFSPSVGFGKSLSLSCDGTILVVGADDFTYVYYRRYSTWELKQTIEGVTHGVSAAENHFFVQTNDTTTNLYKSGESKGYLHGRVSDVAIFHTHLSDADMEQVYNEGKRMDLVSNVSLQSWWSLQNTLGNELIEEETYTASTQVSPPMVHSRIEEFTLPGP